MPSPLVLPLFYRQLLLWSSTVGCLLGLTYLLWPAPTRSLPVSPPSLRSLVENPAPEPDAEPESEAEPLVLPVTDKHFYRAEQLSAVFPDITLRSGRVLHNCEVVRFDARDVFVRSNEGPQWLKQDLFPTGTIPEVTDARRWGPEAMVSIKAVLTEAKRATQEPEPADMVLADQLADQAAQFKYAMQPEAWPLPAVTARRGYGNCAAKSLWLATQLIRRGYTAGIRIGVPWDYQVGEVGHAWVVVKSTTVGYEYVYEPTRDGIHVTQETAPTKAFQITATVYPDTRP